MVRADDDSWNITESVGTTALQTAIVRVRETKLESPLFRDPYAQCFVNAAVAHGWTPPYHNHTVDEVAETDPVLSRWVTAMQDWTASRTKFVDDFFTSAGADGIKQAVIVAAGLDARAWRLRWPDATVVYEIDQPGVLEFKAETLRSDGAEPAARYVAVPVDLRRNWPTVLQQSGFDASVPSSWSVEGLLPYLPPAAQDLLFERIGSMSAPGSRLAVDAYTAEFYDRNNMRGMFSRMDAAAGPRDSQLGDHLLFAEERSDVAAWLTGHGWSISVVSGLEAMARNGRPAAADVDTSSISSNFIEARRPT